MSMGSPRKAEDSCWGKGMGSWYIRLFFLDNWTYLLNDLGSAPGEPGLCSCKEKTIKPNDRQHQLQSSCFSGQEPWGEGTWGQWHMAKAAAAAAASRWLYLPRYQKPQCLPRTSMSHRDPQEKGVRDVGWGRQYDMVRKASILRTHGFKSWQSSGASNSLSTSFFIFKNGE